MGGGAEFSGESGLSKLLEMRTSPGDPTNWSVVWISSPEIPRSNEESKDAGIQKHTGPTTARHKSDGSSWFPTIGIESGKGTRPFIYVFLPWDATIPTSRIPFHSAAQRPTFLKSEKRMSFKVGEFKNFVCYTATHSACLQVKKSRSNFSSSARSTETVSNQILPVSSYGKKRDNGRHSVF